MKKKIYVLEDNEDIREVVSMILSEEAYEVRSFQDITEFMAKDEHQAADLFLLDVMLPDGNGIDVCSTLKTNPLTSSIPVLMMSANANKYQVELSCNAEGFIAKPFDINSFLKTVSHAIGK